MTLEISAQTRVMLPRRSRRIFSRPRLLNRLYDLTDCKAVLLTAPAGYGKTTLLVDWAHDLKHPVCWYALEQSDSDPHVFLERLVLSLSYRFAGFGERTRRALRDPIELSGGAAGVTHTLLNEIAQSIPAWFVLVLDDYHELGNAPHVDVVLYRLLAQRTDQYLIAIASRTMPQWSWLPPLIARGQVAHLDQEELTFEPEEMRQALAMSGIKPLAEDEMAGVVAQADGWITGALLAARARRWPAAISACQGEKSSLLYDYMAREIWDHLEPDVQDFMLVSSTLQVMSPGLCQQALGLEESSHHLALLQRRNLFIGRMGKEWYCYHQLVREYLQNLFRQQAPERWAEMHCRAALWLAEHGQPEDAVLHYVTAGEQQKAAQVMTAAARQMYYAGRMETLLKWGTLPAELVEEVPRLALFQARAADALGRWDEALALTEVAERGYQQASDTEGRAYTLLERAHIRCLQGHYREALALSQQALVLSEEGAAPVAYEMHRLVGLAYLSLDQLGEAAFHLQRACALAQEQATDYELSSAQIALADCLWRQGDWAAALLAEEEALRTRQRMDNPGALAVPLNSLGFFLYIAGEYERACELLDQALDLARKSGFRRDEALTLLSLGELYRDLGSLKEARSFCKEGLTIARELGDRYLSAYGCEEAGLIYSRQGELALARSMIEEAIALAEAQQSAFQMGRYKASLGMVLAQSGQHNTALAVLAEAQARLAAIAAQAELARARLYTAWVLFLASRHEEASTAFGQVWVETAPSNREYLFIIEGSHMLPLFEQTCLTRQETDLLALLERARAFEITARAALSQHPSSRPSIPPSLRIFGFGRGRVELGQVEIPRSAWAGAAARHLLFYLLTHPSCSRDQITANMWPEMPPPKVKAAFHTVKFRLSRALGREALHFDGYRYSLHPELNVWFDVAEFEQLVKGRAPGSRVEQLQKAIALYRGDFLEDNYADWCVPIRERLREQLLDAIEELARLLLARRQVNETVQVLRRGLAIDNLREAFHRLLMCAHVLCGEPSQAVFQYQTCAETLQRELGIGPSSETTRLYRRIAEGRPLNGYK